MVALLVAFPLGLAHDLFGRIDQHTLVGSTTRERGIALHGMILGADACGNLGLRSNVWARA